MSYSFLVEIGTEELPPKALKNLSQSFCRSIEKQLKECDLEFSNFSAFASPRRLGALIKDLPESTPKKELAVWGPPVKIALDQDGNPTKAALAFAKKNGVEFSDLKTENDGKADKLVYHSQAGGEPVRSLLIDIINKALASLPIEKRMRWGSSRVEFVRPVHWVIAMLNNEVIDGEILGVTTGNTSRGHRFHCEGNEGTGELTITHADDYENILLEQGKVVADYSKRQAIILKQIKEQAQTLGGSAIIDGELLDEVSSLVEWPVALGGTFEKRFLDVPSEALISSMKEHQKYFHLVDDKSQLLPYFITISNIESTDPKQIIEGNEKVIRPRLSDAAFFFDEDKKQTLESRSEKLKTVVFQAKLGTLFDKTQRIVSLSGSIAEKLAANVENATRAAQLCKTDLLSLMVYEFPELQGIAGSYYAKNDGENEEVSQALLEQYLPKFSGDKLAQTNAGNIVGLSDRLDTLVGIFGLGQKPTGSKDPFALRRASLSILRILVENSYDLDLKELIDKAYSAYGELPKEEEGKSQALAYILDRFKAHYEDAGISSEVFQSVAAKNLTRPIDIDKRVKAVAEFTQLEEAQALAAANKRVSNILSKQSSTPATEIDTSKLVEDAEKALAEKLAAVKKIAEPLFAKRDYTAGLSSLAVLRQTVDTFFDDVMVMSDDEDLKNNRLALLSQLRALFLEVADISILAVNK